MLREIIWGALPNDMARAVANTSQRYTMSQADINKYWVPRLILERSWILLRQDGLKGVESTVLWGGRRFGAEAVVTTVLYPGGWDVELGPGRVRVGSDTTAEMGRWLREHSLSGLAQVHSHPSDGTRHSSTDDDHSIASSAGFMSLVWPRYADLPVRNISELGVHRLVNGCWNRLPAADADALFPIIESESIIWAPAPNTAEASFSRSQVWKQQPGAERDYA